MKVSLLLLICFFLTGFTPVQAQRPPDYKTVYDSNPDRPFEPMPKAPIHYTLLIAPDGSAELKPPDPEVIRKVTIPETTAFFTGLAAKKTGKDSTWFKDFVTVEPSRSVKFGAIVSHVHAIRDAYTAKIRIESADTIFVLIPKKPSPKKIIKPNPLTLIVTIGQDGKLALNREPAGTLSDTSALTEWLKKIMKEREENGVFRVGSNVIESTVFLKIPLGLTWGEASKVIKAMHDGGADPIGLQIDDLK